MKRSAFFTDTLILIILGAFAALFHILLNGQYGFHRDELDFILSARRLEWGYVAYPPVTPFLARVGLELFGETLRGLRVLPALAQGIVLVLAGLMAREMGGKRVAQWMTAAAVFIAPVALFGGTVIMYFAFDYLWWVVAAYFFVRLLARDNPRAWLGIGAAFGLGMLTKYTMAFWVVGLAAALLATPARAHLRTRWPYLGAALALLIFLPNLVWQIRHDFIALDFLAAIHARDIAWGRTEGFLPKQLFEATNPVSLPLWIAGLAACLGAGAFKRFRALAWMFLVTFALFVISRGRSYYTAPAYVMLFAAGSVWFESWLARRAPAAKRLGRGLAWGFLAAGAIFGVVVMKPIAPVNSALWDFTSQLNSEVVEMIGWPDLTRQVAEIYRSLPTAEQERSVILAGNYGEAGALDFYGAEYGLPRVISGGNSLWYHGYGEFEPQTVIVVGFEQPYAERFFASCEYAGTVTNSFGVRNEESTRHTGLYVCRQPRRPWSEMWADLQWFQ